MINHLIDKKIISSLGASRLDAKSISKIAGIGKTTIQYRLIKMVKIRLVRKIIISNRKILYEVNKKAVNEARDSKILEVFSGVHAIQAYRDFLEIPRQHSIYSIQGTGALDTLIKYLPKKFIQNVHNRQKRKNILIKGFVNQNIQGLINEWPVEVINSHIGRTVGLKMVGGKILKGNVEILCTDSIVMFHNTKKKRVVVIKDNEISKFIFEIVEFLYNTSNIPVLNLNDYMSKIKKLSQKIPREK